MKFEITIPDQVIEEESELKTYFEALQLMTNRMAQSHFKYGNMSNYFPDSACGVDNAKKRVEMYDTSGNTEDCLDAANYMIIEYLFPSHKNSHFRTQSSEESPGVVWDDQ